MKSQITTLTNSQQNKKHRGPLSLINKTGETGSADNSQIHSNVSGDKK